MPEAGAAHRLVGGGLALPAVRVPPPLRPPGCGPVVVPGARHGGVDELRDAGVAGRVDEVPPAHALGVGRQVRQVRGLHREDRPHVGHGGAERRGVVQVALHEVGAEGLDGPGGLGRPVTHEGADRRPPGEQGPRGGTALLPLRPS